MYTLTLDFETHDPNLALKKGAGWVYRDFEILGAAYKIDDEPGQWTSSIPQLRDVIRNAKTIICHNAQYDIGCLHRLQIDYEKKLIVDTMILAKLYDNTLNSYALDSLGNDFFGIRKDTALLEQAAEALGVRKPMAHMKLLFEAFPATVIKYAIQDVTITNKLAVFFRKNLYESAVALIPEYSDLIKALVTSRARGVAIDLRQAEKSDSALSALHLQHMEEFERHCPGVNIESTKQLAAAFRGLGLLPGVSEKGGDSVDSKWRSSQDHPAILALDSAKKYNKLRREFIEGIVERTENGRLYPEINILGAIETGRFSSSNPNVQQIPKRDEVSTPLVRSLFIADPGEKIFALDFSSQEPRLQVHYAYLAGCAGADDLKRAFDENPGHDLHSQVASLAGIDRKVAKTINLGLSYGMGLDKLSQTLKMSPEQAKKLVMQYKKLVPYLYELNKKIQEVCTPRGYIVTACGRRLAVDYKAPYKSLNKLIQGSAADMTMRALVDAYRAGLPVLFSVHDELVMSSSSDEQARELRHIMETALPLEVPCRSEILSGPSWGNLSPLT